MNNSLQLWWCDQATGKDHLRDTTGMTEAQVRREFQSASEKGDDVWLIHPDGRKDLPSGPTPKAEHTPEPELRRIAIDICQACLDGIGEECHTPGCALFLHRVDLPITPERYTTLAGIADPSAVLKEVREALKECEGDLLCYAGDSKYPAKAATLKRVTAALAKLGGKA